MSTSGKEREDSSTSKAKLDDPKIEYYHGDKAKLRTFLSQLRVAFALHGAKYPDGPTRVTFVAQYLRGSAQAWFEPYLTDYYSGKETREPDTEAIFKKFKNFEEAIQQIFGSLDEERTAARMIQQLRQTGSAAQYYSHFRQLVARVDWDDDAKAAAFYMGLSDAVKDQMMPQPPNEYKTLVNRSLQIDNRLYERRMEKNQRYGYRFTGGNRGRRNNYGDPMDLDMMQHGGASRPRKPSHFNKGQGSNQERDRRRRENLCYNCGKSGHRAKECKTQAHGLHMMIDATAGIEEKKADTSMETYEAETAQGSAQKGLEAEEWEEIPNPDNAPIQEGNEDTQFWTRYLRNQKYLTLGAPITFEEAKELESYDKKELTRRGNLTQEEKDWVTNDEFLHPAELQEWDLTTQELLWLDVQRQKVTEEDWEGLPAMPEDARRHANQSWTECYDNDCGIHWEGKNHHGCFPEEPTKRDAACVISMMNEIPDSQEARSIDTSDDGEEQIGKDLTKLFQQQLEKKEGANDTNDGDEAESEEDEPFYPPRTVIREIERSHITILTCFWREVLCKNECDLGTQHYHVVYDKNTKPREFARTLRILLCQDEECPHGPDIHAHQGHEQLTQKLNVPDHLRWRVQKPKVKTQTLAMLIEKTEIGTILDDRGNDEYTSAHFQCTDIDCDYYQDPHEHLRNIDPAIPAWGFRPEHYQAMIEEGKVCDKQECPWRMDLHVHLSKNV